MDRSSLSKLRGGGVTDSWWIQTWLGNLDHISLSNNNGGGAMDFIWMGTSSISIIFSSTFSLTKGNGVGLSSLTETPYFYYLLQMEWIINLIYIPDPSLVTHSPFPPEVLHTGKSKTIQSSLVFQQVFVVWLSSTGLASNIWPFWIFLCTGCRGSAFCAIIFNNQMHLFSLFKASFESFWEPIPDLWGHPQHKLQCT